MHPLALLKLDTIDNRFRLHQEALPGKSSKAFFGEETNSGKQVFIKLLLFPRSDLERALFQNEIHALRELNNMHPRVSPKYLASGAMHENEVMYLVTEKAEGRTLAEYLEEESSCYDFDAKLELFHRVASCVAYCLILKWNHRDLHPGNILLLDEAPNWQINNIHLSPDPKAMVLDWGQAYCDHDAQFEDSPSFMETLHGCYYKSFTASLYASPPEIFRSPAYHHLNALKYDTWSLGLILFKIITGHNCFEFRSLGDYAQSLADNRLEERIDYAASEIASQGNDCSLLLYHFFKRLVCIDAAQRLLPGEVARVMRDLRIEGWRPANEDEASEYISDPINFYPEGGWRHSYIPDLDE